MAMGGCLQPQENSVVRALENWPRAGLLVQEDPQLYSQICSEWPFIHLDLELALLAQSTCCISSQCDDVIICQVIFLVCEILRNTHHNGLKQFYIHVMMSWYNCHDAHVADWHHFWCHCFQGNFDGQDCQHHPNHQQGHNIQTLLKMYKEFVCWQKQ